MIFKRNLDFNFDFYIYLFCGILERQNRLNNKRNIQYGGLFLVTHH